MLLLNLLVPPPPGLMNVANSEWLSRSRYYSLLLNGVTLLYLPFSSPLLPCSVPIDEPAPERDVHGERGVQAAEARGEELRGGRRRRQRHGRRRILLLVVSVCREDGCVQYRFFLRETIVHSFNIFFSLHRPCPTLFGVRREEWPSQDGGQAHRPA